MDDIVKLAVVGGGPNATYLLERLAATFQGQRPTRGMQITVFDRGAHFGDGEVHSVDQPGTSYLNRVIAQVSFAMDETVADAGPLLRPQQRPTFLEWAKERYDSTGDDQFRLGPADWTKRWVHGTALRESFERYVSILRSFPHVQVDLVHGEVVDVRRHGEDEFEVVSVPAGADSGNPAVVVDHVVFATGHTVNDPRRGGTAKTFFDFAETHGARYVPVVYPMNKFLTEDITTDDVVGCWGLGLTAMDVILHLTEGRGGTFEESEDGHLVYRRSGREPRSIVAFSPSGTFLYARPENDKEKGNASRLYHRGVYFTGDSIARLRETVGVPRAIDGVGMRRQLDFEKHLMPLVTLELNHIYYAVLLGPDFAQALNRAVAPSFAEWLDGNVAHQGDVNDALVGRIRPIVHEAAALLDGVLDGTVPWTDAVARASKAGWSAAPALRAFLGVVYGEQVADAAMGAVEPGGHVELLADAEPQWSHARRVQDSLFEFDRMMDPIPADTYRTAEEYTDLLLDFMDRDHQWARQGNLRNPFKAMTDGGLRDLQAVASEAVDFGGLTARSHRWFYGNYARYRKRFAIGTALIVMEKMRALIVDGVLDVGTGGGAYVGMDEAGGRFVAHGPNAGVEKPVDVLVDAKVHVFRADRQALPLYHNLLDAGLIRMWRNPGDDGDDFVPGGLDLDENLRPYDRDGRIVPNLAFLGCPGEGILWLQVGAARPNYNHMVLRDVARWYRGFRAVLVPERTDEAARPRGMTS